MIRFLIDEHLSPALVGRISGFGVFAQHVAHVGLAGAPDDRLWKHAFLNDQAVVTTNARDFLKLAAAADLHPGLVIIRQSGLRRDEQWEMLGPVVRHLLDARLELTNQIVEIAGLGIFEAAASPIR